MNRRTFLISSSFAGIGTLVSTSASGSAAEPEPAESFSWNTGQLQFQFSVAEGRLRQHLILPVGVDASRESLQWAGVVTALLCSGEDSPDSGMKQSRWNAGGDAPLLRLRDGRPFPGWRPATQRSPRDG
jgi:hypothetical protein